MPLIDLTGQRFGRLTVIALDERSSKIRTYWSCRCDCGGSISPRADALRAKDGKGSARSCGCLQREAVTATGRASRKHDYKGSRTYESWAHMVQRCRNSNNGRFSDYGARGIRICERWFDFANFLEDMGECPANLTIERKDNSKGYEPGNCVWATYTAQNRNRRNTIFVPSNGGKLIPLAQYAEETGASYSATYQAFKRGKLEGLRPLMEA